jgi:hypothetical protein
MARQLDAESRNPTDRMAEIERDVLGDQLMAQRELLELETYALRRWMMEPPDSRRVFLGLGVGEQTLDGDERDPFSGVAVINTSNVPVAIGFAPGGAVGAGLFQVPAGSFLVLPVRFVHLSVGVVNAADAAGAQFWVTAARLRVPPIGVNGGQIGPQAVTVTGTATADVSDRDARILGRTRLTVPAPAAAWVSGQAVAPLAAALIADTGALAAGQYRIECDCGIADVAAAGKGIAIEHRDAANAATLHSVVVPAQDSRSVIWERTVIAANERIRAVNLAVAGTAGSVFGASIRAALLP